MGFSPDHKTLAVVAIGSNAVTFIDTEKNAVKHTTYVGRSPHEAFFTPDGKAVWVTVRGEDYISVLDTATYGEVARIKVPGGPGMQIFSPDGRYGYVCSSFNPVTVVIDVKSREIVGKVDQASPFCPNIAATPDGKQVWLTLKDTGQVQVFDAKPPFKTLRVMATGPITNHVNFASTASGLFAYVTIGGLNQVKVFRTDSFEPVATIQVGPLPHGVWPSGDGSRIYVGLENGDALQAIDTATNSVVATVPIGQAPQAIAYVPRAVSPGAGAAGLSPLGNAGNVAHVALAPVSDSKAPATSVSLFDQGLVQVMQAAVTNLKPKTAYVLALADNPDGSGNLLALAQFHTNPSGVAIVDTTGPIRQLSSGDAPERRRYLVIAEGSAGGIGAVVQRQVTP
jgi:YVTN family beta-propeller protein